MAAATGLFFSHGHTSLVADTGQFGVRAQAEVRADGYLVTGDRLLELGREAWDIHGPPLPVVVIALKKAAPE